jgi:threonylcarbamoyladenosine tRNA methylthiotransferase MtaB
MTSFSIRNFGCRVNQAEAFAWAEEFRNHGLAVGDAWEQSDYVLVNSCTLTGRADRDVKRFIHKVARRNPKARLIVTGCLAERAGRELGEMPGVWMVVGNAEKVDLAGKLIESTGASEGRLSPLIGPGPRSRSRTAAISTVHTVSSRACGGRA